MLRSSASGRVPRDRRWRRACGGPVPRVRPACSAVSGGAGGPPVPAGCGCRGGGVAGAGRDRIVCAAGPFELAVQQVGVEVSPRQPSGATRRQDSCQDDAGSPDSSGAPGGRTQSTQSRRQRPDGSGARFDPAEGVRTGPPWPVPEPCPREERRSGMGVRTLSCGPRPRCGDRRPLRPVPARGGAARGRPATPGRAPPGAPGRCSRGRGAGGHAPPPAGAPR